MVMTVARLQKIATLLERGNTNEAIMEIARSMAEFGDQPAMNDALRQAIGDLTNRVENLENDA